jgi:peptidoglycan/xylan/chitin deacetylase (PgdA/CDA1 family)
MIRNFVKAGAARVLHCTHLDRMMGSLTGSRRLPVILAYHRVVDDFVESARTSIPSLLISRQMLERHLDWVGRRYTFVDLDDLGARLESGDGLDAGLAAVTFDDGYSDFYDRAAPLLRKKGIPATTFVVTGLVGTAHPQIHDRLYFLLTRRAGRRIKRPWSGITLPNLDRTTAYQATRTLIETLPLTALWQVIHTLEKEAATKEEQADSPRSLNWEELDRIRRDGFIVGSHTRSHIVMTNEKRSCIGRELSESRAELETRLGTPVRHFAYPGGLFDTGSVEEVARAGYRFGYTGCSHRTVAHPMLTVPRTVLWENSCLDSNRSFSGPAMSCQIHRAFDLVSGCRNRHEAVN